jgi:hypothetical protein
MVNTRSRQGRRHYQRLPARLATAGVPVHIGLLPNALRVLVPPGLLDT